MGSGKLWAEQSPPVSTRPTEVTNSDGEPLPRSLWHYGAYLDLSYAIDFNYPENHLWRSKVTTQRVNELALNMALAYIRKEANESSRWGMELGLQTGRDVDARAPNASLRYGDPYASADTFSHFSRANVSYLAPVGSGLTLTAGLFNSFIGYESFYAKDNINYTRTFMADNSPYFMFGMSAQYRINNTIKARSMSSIGQLSFGAQPSAQLWNPDQLDGLATRHIHAKPLLRPRSIQYQSSVLAFFLGQHSGVEAGCAHGRAGLRYRDRACDPGSRRSTSSTGPARRSGPGCS